MQSEALAIQPVPTRGFLELAASAAETEESKRLALLDYENGQGSEQ